MFVSRSYKETTVVRYNKDYQERTVIENCLFLFRKTFFYLSTYVICTHKKYLPLLKSIDIYICIVRMRSNYRLSQV
jgi:hypothetical protein